MMYGSYLPVNLCKLCTEYHRSLFHASILIANKHKDKALERLPIWFPGFLSSSWGGHVSWQCLLLGLSIWASSTQNYIQCKKLHKGSPFLGTDYSITTNKAYCTLKRANWSTVHVHRDCPLLTTNHVVQKVKIYLDDGQNTPMTVW